MAYEASEIMTAAALLYTNSRLTEATKDLESLKILMIDARGKISKDTNKLVMFGTPNIKSGFLDEMDESDIKKLGDLAAGISAAIAIRKELSKNGGDNIIPKIYMTGNVWPEDVERFRISTSTFNDYNSSDILVSTNGKLFLGISLKKKQTVKAPSPTLINKAFDTILQGSEFDSIKEELYDAREQYFANIVREAVKSGLILKSDIPNFDKLNDGELFTPKTKKTKLYIEKFGKYSYIDIKGSDKLPGKYLGGGESITRDKNSMRFFVNNKLSQRDNVLFKAFTDTLDEHSQLFSDTLIDIILKQNLYKELDNKDIKETDFQFFLVTAIAKISKSGEIQISKASAISLKTTLCGLTRIKESVGKQKPKLVVDQVKTSKSKAAKIFIQLQWGNMTILELEIRYKGSFTSQPQFQATLSDSFETLLKGECSGGRG